MIYNAPGKNLVIEELNSLVTEELKSSSSHFLKLPALHRASRGLDSNPLPVKSGFYGLESDSGLRTIDCVN